MAKHDDRDIEILKVLSTEGRISKADLADRVGLSLTPCWNRLRKLERAGLIECYQARINLKKVAPHVVVFAAVELSDHTAASFRAEDFCKKFTEAANALTIGFGMDDPDIGPLMNESAVAKQEEQVADALARGARLTCGGKRHELGPLFYGPTVLVDVPADSCIMSDETFGPVAAVAPFDTEEEVIARANDTECGLVAYVHSEDPRRVFRMARALQYGMVAVNRTKVTGAPIPFWGTRQSGLGREGARLGMQEFMEVKCVCRDWAYGKKDDNIAA